MNADTIRSALIVSGAAISIAYVFGILWERLRPARRTPPPMRGTIRERLSVIAYLVREGWKGNIGWLHDRAVVDHSELLGPDGRIRILSPITMAEDGIRLTLMRRAGDSIQIIRTEEPFRTVIQGRLLAKIR